MMRYFIGAVSVALASFAASAQAEEDARPLVVLELYTSQGCSSCPPADALLGRLAAGDPAVLALSFHVDYWDYIGWRDTFADPSHNQRQKTYAHRFNERMVYTPELVIQGKVALAGHKEDRIRALVDRFREAKQRVILRASREAGSLHVSLQPVDAPVGAAELHLIRYLPQATVEVRHGENAGRNLTYTHPVMSWRIAGNWQGDAPAEMTLPLTGDLPVAVLVQGEGQGEVLAAANLR